MPIEIRPAVAADQDAIRLLRNDPEALFWSANRNPIRLADHDVWFKGALLHPERHYILVAVDGGTVIGYGRFEVKTTARVSFAVQAHYRGKGYGSLLLDSLEIEARVRNLPELSATCHPANTASLSAFMRAGYVLRDVGWQTVDKGL